MSAAYLTALAVNDPAKLGQVAKPVVNIPVKDVLKRAAELFGGD